jgi:signal transduction histidine kinase
LPDCGGGRAQRQLDHPVLARRSETFLRRILFLVIIAGLVLNTIFLVREIRRNEQHDSFINAVTHELKTPIASIRLYLQTLQRREVGEAQRRQFYESMLLDTERLMHTVEQVLKAGEAAQKKRPRQRLPVEFNRWCASASNWRECAITLQAADLEYRESLSSSVGAGRRRSVRAGRCGGVANGGFEPARQCREVFAGWRAHFGGVGC